VCYETFELAFGDSRRQRSPAISVAKQENEIRLDPSFLAARDFGEADLNRFLIEGCLIAHSPAQIDGLESRTPLLAETRQPRKCLFLQGIPLTLQVLKSGTDEDTESAGCHGHRW